MQTSPTLITEAAACLDTVDLLLTRLTDGNHDMVLRNTDLSAADIENLKRHAYRLIAAIRESCHLEPERDEATNSVLARIAGQTSDVPEMGGCRRWFGAIQGAKNKYATEGGTPVISYHSKPTPARRLLWQLKYPADHPNHLRPDERLRKNSECTIGSRCMTLAHWHKGVPDKIVRNDRRLARDIMLGLQGTVPATSLTARRCRNGHIAEINGKSCSLCRKRAPARRDATKTRRLSSQQKISPSPQQLQLPSPALASLAADLDFSGLLPSPEPEPAPTTSPWLPTEEELEAAMALPEAEFLAWLETHAESETHVAAPQSHPAALPSPESPPWPTAWADEPEETIPPETVLSLLMPKSKGK